MADDLLRTEVTVLLAAWRGGDECARDRLVAVIYDELRRMAGASLRNEDYVYTLQPTALVHELYLRMFASGSVKLNDRRHLFALAARQIRRILVDHARSRKAEKRGGGKLVSLESAEQPAITEENLLDVDEALSRLGKLDEARRRSG